MPQSRRGGKPVRLVFGIATTLAVVVVAILTAQWLESKDERLSAARVELAHVKTLAVALQTMPWDANLGPGAAASTQRRMQGAHAQMVTTLEGLTRVGQAREDLRMANSLLELDYALLTHVRELVVQGRQDQALALNRGSEKLVQSENSYLDGASRDFAQSASQASAVAGVGGLVALLVAVLTCALLFWRFTHASSAAGAASALSDSLIESSTDGIFAFDRSQRYRVWNRALEEMTGVPRSEALGRRRDEVVESLGSSLLDAGEQSLTGERVELQNEHVHFNGHGHQTFDVSFSPLLDQHNRIIGGLGHVRDVTERNELEQQLRQAQKLEAIGQLAGGIAHDFNNLLMAIGGYSSLALAGAPENDAVLQHNLEQIMEATARARMLTEQLLFFARRRERQLEVLDLNALIHESAELLRRLIEPSVSIELDLRDPAWTKGEKAQLEQVLLNLGTNARDAMPDGGVLTIRTRTAGLDHVQLTVEDTGSGIPDDIKPHVFDPFFTTKGTGRGTGLGLASAYGIVTQSGGSIELDSEVGRGTTFTITLPVCAPLAAGSLPTPHEPARVSGATILLAEDDARVRALVTAALEGKGHNVVAKAIPSEALAYVDGGGAFDLVVTDVVMPEFHGGELVERIRATADKPFGVIYMSGYPASDITFNERSVFLQKPFELEELYAIVERLLEGREGVVVELPEQAASLAQ